LAHPDKVRCVALCDVSEDNLRARNEQLGGSIAQYADWTTMLKEHGSEIDAVVMSLPHDLHTEAILDVAAAGKHILAEKPLCTTIEDADRIVEAVRASGIVFMPAHNTLFLPALRKAREMIDAGAVGPVHYVRSQECARTRGTLSGWRASRSANGGGELIDMGCHPLYRLLFLAGDEVTSVRASMGRFHVGTMEGEDTAILQVRFAHGIIGEVLTSYGLRLPYGTHHFHVIGRDGQLFGGRDALFYLPERFDEPARLSLPQNDAFVDQIGYFADCISKKARLLQTVHDARTVVQLALHAAEDAAGWQERAQVRWTGE
jgi:predicted dehydrogenase